MSGMRCLVGYCGRVRHEWDEMSRRLLWVGET